MRQLKYYVACTVDRFIAHPDGTHDGFLMEATVYTQVSLESKRPRKYKQIWTTQF